jgi:pimeloyl-ACP methyl ester carboxylesterase
VLRNRSGSIQKIRLFDGQERNVNYYCTNVDNDTRPIIWFEADSAHGVLDFIGVQTILAQDYNRTSCSYDPPNFGWSDNLPSSLDNFYSYLSPLLLALEQQDQPRILIGWGDGATNILMHALENEDTTQGLVFMDSSPDGIEWLDAQRSNDWTQKQMLDYRQTDLQSRISLMRLILAIAIPWYIITTTKDVSTQFANGLTSQGSHANLHSLQLHGLLQSINLPDVQSTVSEGKHVGFSVLWSSTDGSEINRWLSHQHSRTKGYERQSYHDVQCWHRSLK